MAYETHYQKTVCLEKAPTLYFLASGRLPVTLIGQSVSEVCRCESAAGVDMLEISGRNLDSVTSTLKC